MPSTLLEPYIRRTGTFRRLRDGGTFGGVVVPPGQEQNPTNLSTIKKISAATFRNTFGTRVFPSYSLGTGGKLVADTAALKLLTDLNPGFVSHKMSPDIGQDIIDWINMLWTTYGIQSALTIGEPHSPFTTADWTDVKAKITACGDALYMVNGQNEVNNVRPTAQNTRVTYKQLTNNVATLTVEAVPTSVHIGSGVTITGVDATFNGTYTVTGKTSTTITYRRVSGDLPKTSVPIASTPNAKMPVLPPDWDDQCVNHQKALWDIMNTGSTAVNNVRIAAGKNRILVSNFNIHSGSDSEHDAAGNIVLPRIKGYVDALNFHLYHRGGDPYGYKLDEYIAFYRGHIEEQPAFPVLPIICSESGYFVADNYTGAAKVVTAYAHDIYIRRLHLEWALRGGKVSQFEFLNDPDPTQTDREATFGFIEMDAINPVSAWRKRIVYAKMQTRLTWTGGTNGTVPCEVTTTSSAVKYVAVDTSTGTKLILWKRGDVEVNRVRATETFTTVTVKSIRSGAVFTQTAQVGHDDVVVTL